MGSSTSFPWIRSLAEYLPDAFEIPLFGNAPPFDWNLFSQLLKERISIEECSLVPKEQRWLSANELKQDLGSHPFFASLLLHPLNVSCSFAMSRPDVNQFTAWMMNRKTESQMSEPLREGFFRFLLLAALDAACQIDPLKQFTPQLQEEAVLPDALSFCINIAITAESRLFWGKLILPAHFRRAWKEHFTLSSEYAPGPIARCTELAVGVNVGSTSLSLSEWESLLPGDCLLLDRGSYSLEEQTGIGMMTIGPIHALRVKITPNALELLDFSFIHEDLMEHPPPETPPGQNPGEPSEQKDNVSIREIPLNVSVELTQLKITLERLMQLQPGNLIEMPIQIDQNVSLIINGGKVGTAELIQLGDSLGLRILQIGS